MPLLYGEGREKAFIRLQEAIYNSTADHSLFLFRHSLHHNDQPLLADSPTRFCDRVECTLCLSSGLQTVRCLASDTRYTSIVASERWTTQAHEQIMTTVSPRRNEMSTTLPLLEYRDVSKKLILPDNNENVGVTHVAVLNHTLSKQAYKKGALCLLLRRGASLEAFHRVRSFPALLPQLGELESKLQKTKILICPGASNSTQHHPVNTIFSIKGESFLAQEWSAKGSIQHSNLLVNREFEVRTSESGDSKRSALVSCQIEDSQDSSMKISLKLIRINKVWSIKEVAEVKEGMRSRKPHAPFRSSHLADRCALLLSGGKKISVGIRRRQAACRGKSLSQYRYQIIVRYL